MTIPRTGIVGLAALALLVAMGLLHGCSGASLSGPPALRLGRDECAECGMIINEERCSSALLIQRDGVLEHAVFDDIGCMCDYEQAHTDVAVKGRYVHDHETKEWRSASDSIFACAESFSTPMASGIVAFADSPLARQRAKDARSELLTFAQVMELRATRTRQRHGQQ
jgi:hypothetical protein